MALQQFAINFAQTGDRLNHVWKVCQGLQMSQVEFTWTANGDYSSGFDLDAVKQQLGYRNIFGILGASVVNSARTVHRFIWPLYNPNNGKLRFVVGVGAEIVSGTDIVVGDICRVTLFGV